LRPCASKIGAASARELCFSDFAGSSPDGYSPQRPADGHAHRAIIAVGQTIRAQATIMGYADCFALLGAVLIVAILPVALLKKGTGSGGASH
jgi:DHA2 family multidrug resistance protein